MDKKEYIANQLKKTYGKKYENYCITRIINKLDDLSIKFVTQQMFKREGNEIALADIYFPQVNVWVEIDESHHIIQKEEDRIRTEEVIKKNIKSKLKNLEEVIYIELEEPDRIIIFDKDKDITIEDINAQIDKVVEKIKRRKEELKDRFAPWTNVYSSSQEYITKGFIEKKDNAKFKTLQIVSELFNKGYKGNQNNYFCVDSNNNEYAWCPKLQLNENEFKNNKYDNRVSDDGKYIYESKKDNDNEFVFSIVNSTETRFVFAQYKDETGVYSYKFLGTYIIDRIETERTNKRAWKKISDELDLRKYFK